MIKTTLIAALILAATGAFCQDTAATAGTDSSLHRMPKVELASIFLQEVTRVTNQISTLPLDSAGGDVPATKYTAGKFQKVTAKAEAYGKGLVNHYTEIIPYADRSNLIEAIQYLRSIP